MHNFCLKRSIFIVQHDLKTAYIEHNVNKKKLGETTKSIRNF